ncbi:MAG TPA: trypsin-like peptidase domain-containing protein [Bacteroidales bacterium]|nr:trypsin-like peptidase domain-containing protein [Bacteroidales bacterium]
MKFVKFMTVPFLQKKIIYLASLLLLFSGLKAQYARTDMKPVGILSKLKSTLTIPSKTLMTLDIDSLNRQDSAENIDNRIGILQYVDVDLIKHGKKITQEDSSQVWYYHFYAPNALALGLRFDYYILPEGASMYVYNPSMTEVLGAFTNINNKPDSTLSVMYLEDNEAIVEYHQPASCKKTALLKVGAISMAYKNLASTLAYNDINCPAWTSWNTIKHAICRMVFDDGGTSYYCSGSLINNTRNDGTPYFLTANHCISSQASASSLVTYFNYESTSCNSKIVSNNKQTLSGAKLCANSAQTDFSLLLFYEKPDETYKAYLAGWDNTNHKITFATVIHHPKGLYKSIAQSSTGAKMYPFTIDWDDGTLTKANSHWESTFTNGTINSGSSGSPLFDQNVRIVGQLHGGDNTTNYYGALHVSWQLSTEPTSQLKYWLDPDNTGLTSIDGASLGDIPITNFSIVPLNPCIGAEVAMIDSSANFPDKWKWEISPADYTFLYNTNDTDASPRIAFNRDTIYSITLTTSNLFGSSKSTVKVQPRLYNLNIAIENPIDSICGYKLNKYPLKVTPNYQYQYNISPASFIDTLVNANEIKLTTKDEAFYNGNFWATLIVKASHGACSGYDTMTTLVEIPKNDMLRNAQFISLGESGPYSNRCASVETSEPHPDANGCSMTNKWCYADTIVNNSLWYRFTGPSSGNINIILSGKNLRAAVYKADDYPELFQLGKSAIVAAADNGTSDEQTLSFKKLAVSPAKNYFLQIDGYKRVTSTIKINMYSDAIELYPNPASNIVNIAVSVNVKSTVSMKIVDATGKTVLAFNNLAPSTSYSLDVSNISPGFYYLYSIIDGQLYKKQLIIVK